jgi:hypothetical protein
MSFACIPTVCCVHHKTNVDGLFKPLRACYSICTASTVTLTGVCNKQHNVVNIIIRYTDCLPCKEPSTVQKEEAPGHKRHTLICRRPLRGSAAATALGATTSSSSDWATWAVRGNSTQAPSWCGLSKYRNGNGGKPIISQTTLNREAAGGRGPLSRPTPMTRSKRGPTVQRSPMTQCTPYISLLHL